MNTASMQLTSQVRPFLRTIRPGFKVLASSTSRRGVATKKEDVIKYLDKNGIFSDVISKFEPKVQLQARFLSSGEEASFGNTISPVEAQGRPAIEILPFPGEDAIPSHLSGKTAYVVLTDPDAPSKENPEWSEFCHWIAQVKIPSSKEGREVIHNAEAKETMAWTGPAPPKDTGLHRYVLLLLQGDESNASAPNERKKWGNDQQRTGVKQWAEKYGLKPIGANFFKCEHKEEKTVDELHDKEKGLGVGTGAGYGSA